MAPVTDRSFGILIAFLLPGFVVVWFGGRESVAIQQWLAFDRETAPTVGGFLYVTVASLGLGLVLSTLRWAVIDQIHHRTRLQPPQWDFRRLQEHIDAYRTAVDFHYRYYQFYGNTLMAVLALLAADAAGYLRLGVTSRELLLLVPLAGLFFVASRDALAKYYRRAGGLSHSSLPRQKEQTDDQRRLSS